jgi:hemolysin activation/secretion protein
MILKPIYRRVTYVLLTFCSVGWVHAQPDAGALQQQIESERRALLPGPQQLETTNAPAPTDAGGATLTVNEFRFVGNSEFSSEFLALATADYTNRPLSFSELQAATASVARVYREAGWVARAFLPRQDILDGIVTIQIAEASFGKVVTEGQPSRLSAAQAVARIEAQQQAGQPANSDALDRGLLIADDLPGIAITGALRPGEAAGETDLALRLMDEALWAGAVGADNTGPRSTGEDRLTGRLFLNSPIGYGEQLSAHVIDSKGSEYLRLGVYMPVGADGWRIGANASHFDYTLITPEFKALQAQGQSTSMGLEASYPLIRSRLKNLYFTTAFDNREFENTALAGTTSDYGIQSGSIGLAGNIFDGWNGGGANSASLVMTQGRVHLSKVDLGEDAELQGDFFKLRYSLSRQQLLTSTLSVGATYSGQWSNDNLDSSEKFYLGGSTGVRAYPANEGSGAKGQMLNIDLRWQLPLNLTAGAFYDWGRVTQNIDNRQLNVPVNSYNLKGHGLSLGWQPGLRFDLQATWARRDGNNPNPSITGRDQEGSLDINRWWLTANFIF